MNLDQLIFIWKGRHEVLALFASTFMYRKRLLHTFFCLF